MRRLYGTIVLLWFVLAVHAAGYTPQTVPNPKHSGQGNYVCNPNGIITQDDVQYLNRCATELEANTGVELCVVAIDNIGEYDAFDFSYELFQRWGIGKEGKNTGVLLILVLDSRDIRIMTGGGIEGVLTDAVCHRIIYDDMMPALKEGDYSGGLCIGVLRIYELCTHGEAPEELRNASSVTNRYGYAENDSASDGWGIMVAVLLGISLLCVALPLWIEHHRKCPKCGKRTMSKTSSKVISTATYRQSGMGINVYRCRHCGNVMEKTFVIPKKTRTYMTRGGNMGGGFGGGGFSGGSFGGGSTFGGGAGGRF